MLEEAGAAALGLYMTTTDVPPVEHSLTPAGRTFARDFAASNSPTGYVLPAAQAAEVVLAAIARSDGTRASVLEQLQATKVKEGILGSFSFDRGDITPARVADPARDGEDPAAIRPRRAVPGCGAGPRHDRAGQPVALSATPGRSSQSILRRE